MPSAYISALRQRIGDTSSDAALQVWSDDQLDEWLTEAFREWSYGARSEASGLTEDDVSMGLKLAHSSAMYELATGGATFFKWRDQQKEIDKSMVPESCRRIGKDLWEQVNQQRKDKKGNASESAERKIAQGGVMQFDAGSSMSDRTKPRGWR